MLSTELYSFIIVAECGSFNRASERLHLSAPAVMKHINRLEDELGFLLFKRTHNGLKLSAEGNVFYQSTVKLFSDYEKSIKRARQVAEVGSHIIRIGNSILRPCKPLVDLWTTNNPLSFQFKFRVVPFDDASDNMDRIFRSLGQDFDVLIGICDKKTWENYFQSVIIRKQPFRIGVPYDHPLAERNSLTIEDLFHEKLLVLNPGTSGFIDRLRNDLSQKYPEIILDSTPTHYEIEMFNQCVEENILLLTNDTWKDAHPSLKTIPIDWEYYTTFGIMYPLHPSRDVEAFIQAVKKLLPAIENMQ